VEEQLKTTPEEHRGIQLIAYPCVESHPRIQYVEFPRLYYSDKNFQEKEIALNNEMTLRQLGFTKGSEFYSKHSSESRLCHVHTLAHYNIQNNSIIDLVLKLRGGGGSQYSSFDQTLKAANTNLENRNKENKLGVAVGGTMKQKIYPDKHNTSYWKYNGQRCFIHLVEDTKTRTKDTDVGWYKVSDESEFSLQGSAVLDMVKSLNESKSKTIKDGVW
jgi:hypothetical protein